MNRDIVQLISGYLYEGVLSAQDWQAGLDALRLATGGALFYNFAVDACSLNVVSSLQSHEVPLDKVQEYELHHARNDERMPIVMGLQVGQLMFDHEHFSAKELSRSFIYSDWLPSLGYRHTFSAPLREEAGIREFLSIMLPADQGPFNPTDRELIEQLMPDLMRASRLRARMSQMADQAMLGTAALDTLPQAIAVLDAHCRPVYMNLVAERMLDGRHGMEIRQARLRATHPAVQEKLTTLVAAACDHRGSQSGGVFRSEHEAVQRLTVHVLPLNVRHPLAALQSSEPHALLIWADPDVLLRAAHVGTALGLTETEARLALMLAQGRSIKDFALAQGCSWHTARTHAKNLMFKTGSSKQADVVRLVHSLVWG